MTLMPKASNTLKKKLFDYPGALSNFPKIDVSYAIGLIYAEAQADRAGTISWIDVARCRRCLSSSKRDRPRVRTRASPFAISASRPFDRARPSLLARPLASSEVDANDPDRLDFLVIRDVARRV